MGVELQNLSKNRAVAEFREPEANRKKVSDLLFAAFPAPSAHAVSQRAAVVLDVDPRTIRSWMDGRTRPTWDQVGVICAYVGFERAMQILWRTR